MLNPTIRDALVSADWIWPAYIQNRVVYKLAERLRAASQSDRHTVLEAALPGLYPPEVLAVMLLERYRKVPLVSEFQAPIGEAIEAAHLNLFHSAVTTLFPVIEGIIRKAADSRGVDLGMGTRKLVEEVKQMIEHERMSGLEASDERITMLEIFRDFLSNRLLEKTTLFSGVRNLNRHGVLHGVFSNFGHAANFYILVSILDLLTFIMTFRTSGISVLAPDQTDESRALAQYYRALQAISAIRHKVRARI